MQNMTEIPIGTMPFSDMKALQLRAKGWVYPRRDISPFLPLFSTCQRAAINFYGWVAILCVIAGLFLPFFLESWWWALLIPGGFIVWRANRKSMEQFFLENLSDDPNFYEAAQQRLGNHIKLVV